MPGLSDTLENVGQYSGILVEQRGWQVSYRESMLQDIEHVYILEVLLLSDVEVVRRDSGWVLQVIQYL